MNTLFMALRLSTSGNGKKSTPAIKVAIAAVALSVAVMLAAIAIVLGFKDEITRKVIGFNPHIVLKTVPALSNDEYLVSLTPSLQHILDSIPFVQSYSLSASAPAIFKTPNDFKGVYLRSGSNDYMAGFLKSQIVEGDYPDFEKNPDALLISKLAADQLLLKSGDTLPTYFITNKVDVRPLVVSGIFNSHFSSYDDIYAFSSLPVIQEIGKTKPEEGTNINIYVDNFTNVLDYAVQLRQVLNGAYAEGRIYRYYDIETALNNGANFFSWLSLLDTNVIVILSLMTAVALITLISGMMILIVDKKRFIIIMKALGAPNRMLRNIFVWLTIRVAFTGLIIGNAVMITLLILQEKFHFIPLDPDSYYIDFVPVKLNLPDIIFLNIIIIIITYLMLILPSRFVGSIKVTSEA